MCGIVGCWDWLKDAADYRATVCDMLAHIRHRGPDEMGCYFDHRGGMGTARLSILDLAHGQQPMSDPAGRYWIAFNGEIYNYLELRERLMALGHDFKTTCDTEVLLHACLQWGDDALAMLNGAFAFALYDRATGDLTLARDRFGKRPLYVIDDGGRFAFASEIKAFLSLPGFAARLDATALATIYHTWTPLPDQSPFLGVRQIPAGGFLKRQNRHMTSGCYAPLRFDGEPFAGSQDEAADAVRQAITDAVRLRLRSDVEVGTYLSGGLDSSITTALAVRLGAGNVRSFGVTFDDPAYDESSQQQQVSAHLGTRHDSVHISHQSIAAAFPDAIAHAEVPVFRTAFVPMFLLSQLVRNAGVKVVLTGEGSDEAFLGYNIFKETLLRQNWSAAMSQEDKRTAIAGLYPYQQHFQDAAAAMIGMFDRFATTNKDDALFSHAMRFHNAAFSVRLLRDKPDGLAAMRAMVQQAQPDATPTPLRQAQWLEFKTLLAGYLLSTQGDRMSMAHSVEGRCPLLDPNVVELAASLPIEFLLHGGQEKLVLKRAFEDLLPQAIVQRHKQPYRAPDAAVFLTQRPDYLDAVLSPGELKQVEVLDTDFAARFIAKLLAGDPHRISPRDNQTLILLLSTALLHQQFCRRGLPQPRPIDDLLVRQVNGDQLPPAA